MDKRLKDYRIAVLCGGLSNERDVSLRSGENVYNSIKGMGLNVVKIDAGRDIAAQMKEEDVTLVFNTLHGKWGEDGCVQGVLDLLGIPYTGSGVLASAIGMNKVYTKRLLIAEGIKTPGYLILNKDNFNEMLEMTEGVTGYPVIIKPVSEGSSISVEKANNKIELEKYGSKMFESYDDIFIEKFIEGIEITTGVLGKKSSSAALPVLQLVPKNEFYDYEAKYTKGLTEFIIPAKLNEETYKNAQEIAEDVHNIVGCSGVSRVDAIVDDKDRIWIIEINTLPGMTETSDIPAQAKAAGMSFDELVEKILISALL